ncbi:FAD/NAD(P)-binding domain-containing protein [Thelephora ganbajun]|uniref:FAD/NAD(P)-binding domain-containing protein n=1 Tax=Thelephora ganbajun TaxID=370292 RepID=A0ACB6ZN68_THEGA|nr:FAD/NAD(P)-binding domain-containing protein [Thelephora ganbajun]
MTREAEKRRQKVVIVGGGITGSVLARELSSKLNQREHELLIDARPYAIWLIARARLVMEKGHHPGLEERAFVPHDKFGVHPESEKRPDKHDHSGFIVLEDGEKALYDASILATGSKCNGPADFPDDPARCLAHLEHWRAAFEKANDVVLVGGGGVGIELAGELKDYYSDKKVVYIVHGRDLLLNEQFPDKFRKLVNQELEATGVELVLGDYVATFPENSGGEVVFHPGNTLQADLVVPTYGPKPDTAWISEALGPNLLSPGGCVRVWPTLHP